MGIRLEQLENDSKIMELNKKVLEKLRDNTSQLSLNIPDVVPPCTPHNRNVFIRTTLEDCKNAGYTLEEYVSYFNKSFRTNLAPSTIRGIIWKLGLSSNFSSKTINWSSGKKKFLSKMCESGRSLNSITDAFNNKYSLNYSSDDIAEEIEKLGEYVRPSEKTEQIVQPEPETCEEPAPLKLEDGRTMITLPLNKTLAKILLSMPEEQRNPIIQQAIHKELMRYIKSISS